MRFKIDENLPVDAAELLRAAGHEADTVHDEHLSGHPDPDIAATCQREQLVLVTLDLDFSDIRAYPPGNYFGIVVLRPRSQAKPFVLALLQKIVPLIAVEPLVGTLWRADEKGLRILGQQTP